MWKKFAKNDNGFTGLEAAIVLVAFVVVAAVFSYVMLGAGFYTTQKSQQVVHTGVQQASSSVELSGDVLASGASGKITTVNMFLQLTSGGSPVDMSKTMIVVSSPDIAPTDLTLDAAADADNFAIIYRYNGGGTSNSNNILDKFEKFEVQVNLDAIATAKTEPDNPIGPNEEFQIEIKPPQGASYTIQRQAPASIDAVMTLV